MTALEMCAATVVGLAAVLAEGTPAPRRAANELSPSAALGAERDASKALARRDLSDTAGKLRTLQTQVEDLQKDAEEVDALRKNRKGIGNRSPFWRIDREVELAGKAKRAEVERDFLESLIRSAGANPPADLPSRSMRGSVLTGVWTAVALSVLEQNVPGKEKEFLVPSAPQGFAGPGPQGGVRGVLIRWSLGGRGDEFGTALAAIDSYQDERAAKFLLDLALKPADDRTLRDWSFWAMVFLRDQDPATVKPNLQATYEAAQNARSADGGKRGLPRDPLVLVRSVLDDLEYAESLQPQARKRFQRMLRLPQYTYALSPRGTTAAPRANPAILFPSWQDGDERFLPHLLATGRMPAHIILAKAPISAEGWAWLKLQAEWGDWPARVKAGLAALLREREGVTERPERPERKGSPKR